MENNKLRLECRAAALCAKHGGKFEFPKGCQTVNARLNGSVENTTLISMSENYDGYIVISTETQWGRVSELLHDFSCEEMEQMVLIAESVDGNLAERGKYKLWQVDYLYMISPSVLVVAKSEEDALAKADEIFEGKTGDDVSGMGEPYFVERSVSGFREISEDFPLTRDYSVTSDKEDYYKL